jgi:glyoxalase family protein
MTAPLAGLHHVSALSARIRESNDFYTRVLGMRPLIRTVNQDEPSMYHLFYGDGAGRPGSEMTVFDLPLAAPERPGNHSISQTAFRVAGEASLAYWAERLAELGVSNRPAEERGGRRMLDLADPVGTQLTLVDDGGAGEGTPWAESPVPAEYQVRGLAHIEITVPELEPTRLFLEEALGLRFDRRYEAAGGTGGEGVHVFAMGDGGPDAEVHVVVHPRQPRARYGSGGVHHVALRVPVDGEISAWAERLTELGHHHSGVVERFYFTSVYVREPNGILFELATDGPGFEVDGPLDASVLRLPPFLEPRRAEIEAALKPL